MLERNMVIPLGGHANVGVTIEQRPQSRGSRSRGSTHEHVLFFLAHDEIDTGYHRELFVRMMPTTRLWINAIPSAAGGWLLYMTHLKSRVIFGAQIAAFDRFQRVRCHVFSNTSYH